MKTTLPKAREAPSRRLAGPKSQNKWMGPVVPCTTEDRPGRNDPCPCGSRRKYKRCCARKVDAEALAKANPPKDEETSHDVA